MKHRYEKRFASRAVQKIKYSGNTRSMKDHISRHHPEITLTNDGQTNARMAPPKNTYKMQTLDTKATVQC